MQYSLIFEDSKVAANYNHLFLNQRLCLVAAYLLRQQSLVERFDKVYGEALTPIFVHGLQVAIDGNEEEKKKCYSISEANIPDTDEFSEEEGAYAQNAMISLYYFLGNALSEDGASIQGAIGLMLENLDLLNYESDHNYDQSTMILNEITVVLDMISVIVRAPSSDATLANSTARGYML